MGEAKRKQLLTKSDYVLDTFGGRVSVRWDEQATATAQGQLAFFVDFLSTTGVFEAWVKDCPLSYASPNASKPRDILGTLLLSVLAGHNRYSHVTGLRSDGASAHVLGMTNIASEDAVRRALGRITIEQSAMWLQKHLSISVQPALDHDWILDIDTTIKPLFGKQEGAIVSYNPHKPGRPSHALHSYFVGNLRLVLDVDVSAGDEHSSGHTLPNLTRLLGCYDANTRPKLVRGDCGFGNDPFISALEDLKQPYLLKIRKTKSVQRLIATLFNETGWTQPKAGDQGWSAIESELKLAGWACHRRVIVLRREIKQDVVLARAAKKKSQQLDIMFPDSVTKAYEYAVLLSNSDYPIESFGQLYRDRADAENGFDELKNQWGWGGFTTQDLARCQTSARIVALIYNWWSWYCRSANPDNRMEAITSRPLLLAGVARMTSHGNQKTLHLTTMHANAAYIKSMIANIQNALAYVRASAEQLPKDLDRWRLLLKYVIAKMKITQIFLPIEVG